MNKAILFSVLVLCLCAANCHAADAPLISKERISVATGLNYEWRTTPMARSESLCGRHAEWAAGLFGAYNLTPHTSLVASTVLGLDSRQFRHSLGVRVRLFQGDRK